MEIMKKITLSYIIAKRENKIIIVRIQRFKRSFYSQGK